MVQFKVHLIINLELHLKVHFKDLYKGTQKDEPEIALKGALQVTLELHLFRQFSVHKSVQYDSVEREIEVALYAKLEDASKISF